MKAVFYKMKNPPSEASADAMTSVQSMAERLNDIEPGSGAGIWSNIDLFQMGHSLALILLGAIVVSHAFMAFSEYYRSKKLS
ncbi:MAG: hypothetical protein ACPGRX_04795 [Bdellovibrionales bacterium]